MQSEKEIGIKYFKYNTGHGYCLLIPMEAIEGYSVGDTFYNHKNYKIANTFELITESEYIIDDIVSFEKLTKIYDDHNEKNILEYHFLAAQDSIYFVTEENNELKKVKIDLKNISSKNCRQTFTLKDKEPVTLLNIESLNKLLKITNIETLKKELEELKSKTIEFKKFSKKTAVSSIIVENGHVVEAETNFKIIDSPKVIKNNDNQPNNSKKNNDISITGLEKYLKERVFGHDKELKIIAKTLIMNYRSTPIFGTEPILIIGPTGTGKTEVIKSAAEYLNLSYIKVNSPNLVPQGIRGSSIEDYLNALAEMCKYELKEAEKSIIAFDEFDKLGDNNIEYKQSIVNIMLDFLSGGDFLIDNKHDDYTFNTTMLNKIYAGAFEYLFKKKKNLGFGAEKVEEKYDPRSLYEKDYFDKQLISRMQHKFIFSPLDRATQKRAILEAKNSILLLKKKRYLEQFGVYLDIKDDYIEAIIDKLNETDKSMRDLNNLILNSLDMAECAILEQEKRVKRLVLTHETVTDPNKFTLD